jgi:hypothetical protein
MFNFNIKDILLDIIFVKYPRLPNNQKNKIQYNSGWNYKHKISFLSNSPIYIYIYI